MNKAIYFIFGMGVGAVGAYIVFKERFKAAEKELYSRKYEERKETPEKEEEPPKDVPNTIEEKPDLMEYAKKLSELRYARKDEESKNSPYVITSEEFDSGDYDKTALVYYTDGVLAYEIDDEIFENAEEIVGNEFKDNPNDGEVFVRNDDEKMDFDIYFDERTYEEVSGNKPKPHGSEE